MTQEISATKPNLPLPCSPATSPAQAPWPCCHIPSTACPKETLLTHPPLCGDNAAVSWQRHLPGVTNSSWQAGSSPYL